MGDRSDFLDRLDELALGEDLAGVEREALAALEGAPDDAELWDYVAWARFEQGRYEACVDAAARAGDALLAGKASFHAWRFEEAADWLAELEDESESESADRAEAAFLRGVLAEFAGRDGTAEFERAARLAPGLFLEPVRLDEDEIAAVLKEAVEALPEAIRKVVDETVVEVRPLPEPHADVDPLSLGLYLGTSRLERTLDDSGQLPSRIEVYQRNVERIAADREEAIDELRVTLLHEIGHHLGFDEEGVEELGLG